MSEGVRVMHLLVLVCVCSCLGSTGCDSVLSRGTPCCDAAPVRDQAPDERAVADSAARDSGARDAASAGDDEGAPDGPIAPAPDATVAKPDGPVAKPDGPVAKPDALPGNIVKVTSCAQAAVQSAINAAANGDTVLLPGGSCTWASAVSIPGSKALTLDGGGATIDGAVQLTQNGSASSRITNLSFVRPSSKTPCIAIGGTKASAPFRVDHNTFSYAAGGSTIIEVSGNAPGLIDNNKLDCPGNCEMIHNMGMGPTDPSGWSDDIVPGSAAAVYIEDNVFTNTGATGNPAYFWGSSAVQSYYGARTVFRYNTLVMSQVDQHGTSGMIGARWWEVYENMFSTDVPNASQCCFITLRAGSGVVFGNHHVGANLNGDSIDLYEEDTGYPALYQVGRGKNQVLDPAYLWSNDAFFSIGSQTPAMVQPNRDYYLAPRPGYQPLAHPFPLGANGLPGP